LEIAIHYILRGKNSRFLVTDLKKVFHVESYYHGGLID